MTSDKLDLASMIDFIISTLFSNDTNTAHSSARGLLIALEGV